MIILHDISNFMTWFVSQVVNIFSFCYSTLASLEFGGTNLLNVLLTIFVLSTLIPILITIVENKGTLSINESKSRIRKEKSRNDKKS